MKYSLHVQDRDHSPWMLRYCYRGHVIDKIELPSSHGCWISAMSGSTFGTCWFQHMRFKSWRVFRGWNTGIVFVRMAAVAGALGWLCAYHVNSSMVAFNYALIGSVKLEGCMCIRGRAKSVSFPSKYDCDIISSPRVQRVCVCVGWQRF